MAGSRNKQRQSADISLASPTYVQRSPHKYVVLVLLGLDTFKISADRRELQHGVDLIREAPEM